MRVATPADFAPLDLMPGGGMANGRQQTTRMGQRGLIAAADEGLSPRFPSSERPYAGPEQPKSEEITDGAQGIGECPRRPGRASRSA